MLLIGIVPPPSDPALASGAYGGMLGADWEVEAFNAPHEIPDDVAAEVEFLVVPPPAAIEAATLARMPKLRLIQVPGHGFDHIDLVAAAAAGVPVATVAIGGAENAGLLAAQILALGDPALADALRKLKAEMAEKVAEKDARLQKKLGSKG